MRGAHPERALEQAVAQTLRLASGETLLVAASGGPDSTALAALAAGAAAAAGAHIVLAHVNHGIRPEAWQDEGVVLAAGAALGARVVCRSVSPPSAAEATLRDLRYAALAEVAGTVGASRICTAHHAEDQTETVLLALFRGSGPDGLGGMETERTLADGLTLLRPLLRVSPHDLSAYCLSRDLPFASDRTNLDERYRRNALRSALAPLRAAFPHLDEAVARHAEIARGDAAGTARARLRAGLRNSLEDGDEGTRELTFERLEAAARLIESGRPGRVFIKRGVELTVGRG